jgi:hypothetical protein
LASVDSPELFGIEIPVESLERNSFGLDLVVDHNQKFSFYTKLNLILNYIFSFAQKSFLQMTIWSLKNWIFITSVPLQVH